MTAPYFSDQERGPRPRTEEVIGPGAWGGIIAAIENRVHDGSFGYGYPEVCPDNNAWISGCDEHRLRLALTGDVPEIEWPLRAHIVPSTLAILDMLQFLYRAVAMPDQEGGWHPFFGHRHLDFDVEAGRAAFRADINRILARNGLVYELGADGTITRLAPPALREALGAAEFYTGDDQLNTLLEVARAKFLSPDPAVRREALEKLWDAWERLKTLEPGSAKPQQIAALLARAAPEPTFQAMLESESRELTSIGNTFHIRHTETTQVPLRQDEHADYLFHRLFALIRLLLRSTGRGI